MRIKKMAKEKNKAVKKLEMRRRYVQMDSEEDSDEKRKKEDENYESEEDK